MFYSIQVDYHKFVVYWFFVIENSICIVVHVKHKSK